MRVITFAKRVKVATKSGDAVLEIGCNPGERLIFNDDDALSIQNDPGSARYIEQISDLRPYLSEMESRQPPNWRKQRILFYRGRGVGDQLIVSAASRFFTEMLGATCFQATDRIHEPIWIGNPYVNGAAIAMPINLDVVYRSKGPLFVQGAFFLESITEWDSDGEQPNVYDRLFTMLGLDSGRVAPKFKRPTVILQKQDIDVRIKWLKQVAAATNKSCDNGYIVFQFRSTNKVRTLPTEVIEKALFAINQYAEKFQIPILVTDNKPLLPDIAEIVKRTKMALNVANAINHVRLFIGLIAGATAVVGPDSSAIHIAAAFEIPAVGIWGAYHPESRTLYYPRQIHLFHPEQCPNAPCFNYLPDLPFQKCPRQLDQKYCEVFEGVTPDEIFEALKTVNS
jgi:Glycosyltransferase family 9 (heptosyltransferase)